MQFWNVNEKNDGNARERIFKRWKTIQKVKKRSKPYEKVFDRQREGTCCWKSVVAYIGIVFLFFFFFSPLLNPQPILCTMEHNKKLLLFACMRKMFESNDLMGNCDISTKFSDNNAMQKGFCLFDLVLKVYFPAFLIIFR